MSEVRFSQFQVMNQMDMPHRASGAERRSKMNFPTINACTQPSVEDMARLEFPTTNGPFVLEFVEEVASGVWRVEGRINQPGRPRQTFHIRVLPPLTIEERVRRWERSVVKAKRAGLPIPPKPTCVAEFQAEREARVAARIRAEQEAAEVFA